MKKLPLQRSLLIAISFTLTLAIANTFANAPSLTKVPQCPPKNTLQHFIKILLNDTNLVRRRQAALILRGYRYPESINALLEALEDEDTEVKRNSIRSLGELRAQKAVVCLEGFLHDQAPEIRITAAHSLGQIRAKRSVSSLLAQIQDPHPLVISEVIWALGEIGDSRAIPLILDQLSISDPQIRSSAAASLGAFAEKRIIPYLQKVYNNDSVLLVRQQAALSLERLGDKVVFPTE